MPIYEYGCRECGHKFEKLQRISDDPIVDCPDCGADGKVKKLVSRTSFVLKGGGWYKDHYGLSGGAAPSSGPSASDSSASDSSASDSSASDSSGSDSSASSSSSDSSASSSSSDSGSSSGSDDG